MLKILLFVAIATVQCTIIRERPNKDVDDFQQRTSWSYNHPSLSSIFSHFQKSQSRPTEKSPDVLNRLAGVEQVVKEINEILKNAVASRRTENATSKPTVEVLPSKEFPPRVTNDNVHQDTIPQSQINSTKKPPSNNKLVQSQRPRPIKESPNVIASRFNAVEQMVKEINEMLKKDIASRKPQDTTPMISKDDKVQPQPDSDKKPASSENPEKSPDVVATRLNTVEQMVKEISDMLKKAMQPNDPKPTEKSPDVAKRLDTVEQLVKEINEMLKKAMQPDDSKPTEKSPDVGKRLDTVEQLMKEMNEMLKKDIESRKNKDTPSPKDKTEALSSKESPQKTKEPQPDSDKKPASSDKPAQSEDPKPTQKSPDAVAKRLDTVEQMVKEISEMLKKAIESGKSEDKKTPKDKEESSSSKESPPTSKDDKTPQDKAQQPQPDSDKQPASSDKPAEPANTQPSATDPKEAPKEAPTEPPKAPEPAKTNTDEKP